MGGYHHLISHTFNTLYLIPFYHVLFNLYAFDNEKEDKGERSRGWWKRWSWRDEVNVIFLSLQPPPPTATHPNLNSHLVYFKWVIAMIKASMTKMNALTFPITTVFLISIFIIFATLSCSQKYYHYHWHSFFVKCAQHTCMTTNGKRGVRLISSFSNIVMTAWSCLHLCTNYC